MAVDNNNNNHTIIRRGVGGSAPPTNWAQKLKQKSTKRKKKELDSSQPLCDDGEKVRHVLEVLNMRQTDIQNVTAIFRHFKIEFNTLISVQKRWFVIFDYPQTAVNALNIVKNNRFKLRRIDTNVDDVKMLKNNVPPHK
eukprot:UN09769